MKPFMAVYIIVVGTLLAIPRGSAAIGGAQQALSPFNQLSAAPPAKAKDTREAPMSDWVANAKWRHVVNIEIRAIPTGATVANETGSHAMPASVTYNVDTTDGQCVVTPPVIVTWLQQVRRVVRFRVCPKDTTTSYLYTFIPPRVLDATPAVSSETVSPELVTSADFEAKVEAQDIAARQQIRQNMTSRKAIAARAAREQSMRDLQQRIGATKARISAIDAELAAPQTPAYSAIPTFQVPYAAPRAPQAAPYQYSENAAPMQFTCTTQDGPFSTLATSCSSPASQAPSLNTAPAHVNCTTKKGPFNTVVTGCEGGR